VSATLDPGSPDALLARIAQLEATLSAERAALSASRALVAQLAKDVEVLRSSHDRLRLDLELLRHRLFIAKAERIDSRQLELEFATKLAHLDELSKKLREQEEAAAAAAGAPPPPSGTLGGERPKTKPSGRRDLRKANLPEQRLVITDPTLDNLVAEGKAKPAGFEESCRLVWQRAGYRRLVVARAKYKTLDEDPMIETTALPPAALPRSIASPSLLGHIVHEKFGRGLPLYRLEQSFVRLGAPLDRGTMSRWLEDLGALVGSSIIEAARKEALATAFCISTDATGIAILPERTSEKKRQACRRGHLFVQIADRDHVFLEFTPSETSEAVAAMFRGFKGYVQADAKSVFNILFRAPPNPDVDERKPATEVACWSHARRKFWEAAIATKSAVAREAVYRIRRIYQNEESWREKPPDELARLRRLYTHPELASFFEWAATEHDKVKAERGLLRTAFGYVLRQKDALMRFLDDGRLRPDNNASERELRQVAVGRKAWLFVGSDDHAQSAANLMSLIASARLHDLDAEEYLRDVFRVLPHWPKDRSLELAPKYWKDTRARLDSCQLAAEFGPLTIPDRITPPAQEQSAAG
jgi:transposase